MHRGAWLAQSEEHLTLDLWIVSSSPTLGVEITYINKTFSFFKERKMHEDIIQMYGHFGGRGDAGGSSCRARGNIKPWSLLHAGCV